MSNKTDDELYRVMSARIHRLEGLLEQASMYLRDREEITMNVNDLHDIRNLRGAIDDALATSQHKKDAGDA